MGINLEYYRAFYYVAIYESISRAAEEMYVSQPAVSKAIQNLEKQLSCTLFVRSPHGTKLTRDGTQLFTHVSQAFKEFQLGEHLISRRDGYQEDIYIGTTESPLYSIILPILSVFKEKFPSVRFHINSYSSSELIYVLDNGLIDMAFGVTPIIRETVIPLIALSDISDIFFVHQDFPIDDSVPLTPQQLANFPIVGVSAESSAGMHIIDFFKAHGVEYSPMFTVETSTQILPFVTNKLAIGIAPEWVLKVGAGSETLHILNTEASIPTRKMFLAINKKYPISPVCHKFIDMVKEFGGSGGLDGRRSALSDAAWD